MWAGQVAAADASLTATYMWTQCPARVDPPAEVMRVNQVLSQDPEVAVEAVIIIMVPTVAQRAGQAPPGCVA